MPRICISATRRCQMSENAALTCISTFKTGDFDRKVSFANHCDFASIRIELVCVKYQQNNLHLETKSTRIYGNFNKQIDITCKPRVKQKTSSTCSRKCHPMWRPCIRSLNTNGSFKSQNTTAPLGATTFIKVMTNTFLPLIIVDLFLFLIDQ